MQLSSENGAMNRRLFNDFPRKIKEGLAKLESLRPSFPRTIKFNSLTTMSDLLDEDELNTAMRKCPEWDNEGKYITRVVEFEEFMEGIDFVNDVGEIADEAHHHPEISVKHTKVTLKLTTHDVGGVTDLDIQLAQRIDNLVD